MSQSRINNSLIYARYWRIRAGTTFFYSENNSFSVVIGYFPSYFKRLIQRNTHFPCCSYLFKIIFNGFGHRKVFNCTWLQTECSFDSKGLVINWVVFHIKIKVPSIWVIQVETKDANSKHRFTMTAKSYINWGRLKGTLFCCRPGHLTFSYCGYRIICKEDWEY